VKFFSLLLLLLAALAPLRAQEDQPVHMRPEFPLAFPITAVGREVTVKYPVMINQSTVIKPGMQMRVLYRLSDGSQGMDLGIAHAGTLEESFSRDPSAGNQPPSRLMHEIEGYRRTVWEVPNNFVLTWAQFPTESLHLIYSPTDKDSDLKDEMFNFFDGLFVGSPNGKVTVIAVEKDSVAEKAGMKAGDTILAVGTHPTKDDLITFANDYAAAKDDAKLNETPTYPMMLVGADGKSRTANLAMPMRLKGGLMDGFSDKP
jgi:membrane-associated protease RseP (regulator of RpoE activity)